MGLAALERDGYVSPPSPQRILSLIESTCSLGSNANFRNQLGVVAGRADSSEFKFLERRERRDSVGFARSWATCLGRFQWRYPGRMCLEKPFIVSNAKPVILARYPMIHDYATSWCLMFKSAADFAARRRSSGLLKEHSSISSAGIATNPCCGRTKKRQHQWEFCSRLGTRAFKRNVWERSRLVLHVVLKVTRRTCLRVLHLESITSWHVGAYFSMLGKSFGGRVVR